MCTLNYIKTRGGGSIQLKIITSYFFGKTVSAGCFVSSFIYVYVYTCECACVYRGWGGVRASILRCTLYPTSQFSGFLTIPYNVQHCLCVGLDCSLNMKIVNILFTFICKPNINEKFFMCMCGGMTASHFLIHFITPITVYLIS